MLPLRRWIKDFVEKHLNAEDAPTWPVSDYCAVVVNALDNETEALPYRLRRSVEHLQNYGSAADKHAVKQALFAYEKRMGDAQILRDVADDWGRASQAEQKKQLRDSVLVGNSCVGGFSVTKEQAEQLRHLYKSAIVTHGDQD